MPAAEHIAAHGREEAEYRAPTEEGQSGHEYEHDWLVGESMPDRHGLVIPADTPAGEYVLRLEVYASRHKQSLPIAGQNSASLELARVKVTGGR